MYLPSPHSCSQLGGSCRLASRQNRYIYIYIYMYTNNNNNNNNDNNDENNDNSNDNNSNNKPPPPAGGEGCAGGSVPPAARIDSYTKDSLAIIPIAHCTTIALCSEL